MSVTSSQFIQNMQLSYLSSGTFFTHQINFQQRRTLLENNINKRFSFLDYSSLLSKVYKPRLSLLLPICKKFIPSLNLSMPDGNKIL